MAAATSRRCMINLVSDSPRFQLFLAYGHLHHPSYLPGLVLNVLLLPHPASLFKLQFQYNPCFTVPEAQLHSSLALFSSPRLLPHIPIKSSSLKLSQTLLQTISYTLLLLPPVPLQNRLVPSHETISTMHSFISPKSTSAQPSFKNAKIFTMSLAEKASFLKISQRFLYVFTNLTYL